MQRHAATLARSDERRQAERGANASRKSVDWQITTCGHVRFVSFTRKTLGASPCAVPATTPKTKAKTQTAFFRVSSSSATIDKDAGIIRGVKIAEVGKLATFAGPDGKPRSIKISPAWIDALLGHAGNRALPIHHTHEWFNSADKPDADSVELNARVGALKSFRKDESGDAIADAYLYDTGKRTAILSSAEHNPEDLMFSAVFNYSPDDANAMPLNFRAADIVPCGAATTALFSESTQTSNTMDEQEFITKLAAALKDPTIHAAVTAMVKATKPAPEETAADDTASAEMESAAGVTDADKKDEDKDKPALMRAAIRCERARNRKMNEFIAGEKTALLAEVKTASKAEATALLGKSGFQTQGAGGDGGDAYTATLATFKASEPNDQKAVYAMLKKHPELQANHDAKMRERVEKLRPAA